MRILHNLLINIGCMHLYSRTQKKEAFFKTVVFWIAWVMGVKNIIVTAEVTALEVGAAFLLFALSLLMEYVVIFFKCRKFVEKVFPGSLTIMSTVVFIISFTFLHRDATITDNTLDAMKNLSYICLFIISFDTLLLLWVTAPDPPGGLELENKLGQIQIGG